jgi:SNF2 family DNA or RNA helicase
VFDGEKAMKRWQAGQVEILLLHPASAGHGVDGLQAGGAIVVWYSPTWSLELYQQANARLIRYGQKNTVLVGVLVAEGTIDEEVMAVQRSKAAGQDRLLEALKRRIE